MYMYRIFLYVSIILAAGLCSVLPAGDVPVCNADNSTSVNATLISPDMEAMATALTEAEAALEEHNAIFAEIFIWIRYFLELVLLLVFIGYALLSQKDNVFLYCVTAAISVIVGVEWLNFSPVIGGGIFFPFSGYMLYEAVMNSFFRKKA